MECSGELSFPETVLLGLFHAVSAVMSMGGNFLILAAIRKTRRLHSISNCFIASLAGADFLAGFLVNPLFVARSVLNIWNEHHSLVIATEWASMLSLLASTLNLTAVSLDRYVAVTCVFRYQEIVTAVRCIGVIALTWVFSFAFSFLRLLVLDPLDLPKLWIAVAIVGYTIPFGVIAFCYYHIYKAAGEQNRRIAATNTSEIRQFKKDRKAAWTVGIVIGLYVVLALPSMAVAAIQMLTTNDCMKIQMIRFWSWGALFSFASSACNPWVYALRSRDFKSAFESMLRRNNGIRPAGGAVAVHVASLGANENTDFSQ